MSVRVVVPGQLRAYTGGAAEVEADGGTLGAVLLDLDARYPGFRFRIIDEQDRVRRHILIFVGEEREERLDAPVPAQRAITIVGALSGG